MPYHLPKRNFHLLGVCFAKIGDTPINDNSNNVCTITSVSFKDSNHIQSNR